MAREKTREQILDEARKLKALAEGTTFEAEAFTALTKLQNLMDRHNLTEGDLREHAEFRRAEAVADEQGGVYGAPWVGWIATIVADNFRCFAHLTGAEAVYRNGRFHYTRQNISFVGLETDAALASMTHRAAVNIAEKLADRYIYNREVRGLEEGTCFCGCGEKPKGKTAFFLPGHDPRLKKVKNSWLYGFVMGLRDKFRENVQTMALVLVKDDAVIKHAESLGIRTGGKGGRKTSETYYADGAARAHGYDEGRMFQTGGRIEA